MGHIRPWWEDLNCQTANISPLCQHERVYPDGCNLFNGHCYVPVLTRTTYEHAENDCYTRGGHIASLHSEDEQAFIWNLQTDPKTNLWLGASDSNVEVKVTDH